MQTDSLRLSRKNDIHPFEPGAGVWVENQGQKSNCSLFAIGMHSKKRPNNLVMGRLYNFHMFDMVEFGIKGFAPISSFQGAQIAQLGNKVRVTLKKIHTSAAENGCFVSNLRN